MKKIFKHDLLREGYDNFNLGVNKDMVSQKSFTDHGFEQRVIMNFASCLQYTFFILMIFFLNSEHVINF